MKIVCSTFSFCARKKRITAWPWCFVFLLTVSAFSGEILLVNGDHFRGEILFIKQEFVVWQSPLVGRLRVKKDQIIDLQSSTPLKIRGKKIPCTWVQFEGARVRFSCEDGSQIAIPFLSIEEIVQFEKQQLAREYRGKVNATGNQTIGNVRTQRWRLDSDINLKLIEFRHKWILNYSNELVDESGNFELIMGGYSLRWDFAPQTFLFFDTQSLKDERRQLINQQSFGSGLGYQFWESKQTAFSVETGGQYTNELSDTDPDPNQVLAARDEFASLRAGSEYRYEFIREIEFTHAFELLRSLDETDDWQIGTSFGLGVPIARGITADVKYEYNYDNLPANNVEKRFSKLHFGVGYKW